MLTLQNEKSVGKVYVIQFFFVILQSLFGESGLRYEDAKLQRN